MKEGKILVISGPSGVGKTTLYKKLISELGDKIIFSISATTRSIRQGEKDGADYYFLSKEDFQKKIDNGEFVEWAQVYNNLYGTLKSELDRILSEGKSCFLDVDVQGGMNIKKNFPLSRLIFVSPPSLNELEKRLKKRAQDSGKDMAERIKTAAKELELADKYDYNIVNDDFMQAFGKLKKLVIRILNENPEGL